MNEIIEKESINIESMIYEIRGVQVMLSSDVAILYHTISSWNKKAKWSDKKKY